MAVRTSTPPPDSAVLTRDFTLASELQASGLVTIRRVVPEVVKPLRPSPGELLLVIDLDSVDLSRLLSTYPRPALDTGFPCVVLLTRSDRDGLAAEKELQELDDPCTILLQMADWQSAGRLPEKTGEPVNRPAQTNESEPPPPNQVGAVLRPQAAVLHSPKGGVGCTTTAVNLAVRARRLLGLKVILVDLDLAGGDVALHLDMLGRPGLIDLVAYEGAVTGELIRRFALTHSSSGIDVLLAPGRAELARLAGWRELEPILAKARLDYDLMVIDTSGCPADSVALHACSFGSTILAVVTPDIAVTHRLKASLDLLTEECPGWKERTHLVGLQWKENAILGAREVEEFLEMPFSATIPYVERQAQEAIARSRPLAMAAGKNGPFAASLDQLLSLLFPGAVPKSTSPPWWRRFSWSELTSSRRERK